MNMTHLQTSQKFIIKLSGQAPSRQLCNQYINAVIGNAPQQHNELTMDLAGIDTLNANELSALLYCRQYADKCHVDLLLIHVSKTLMAFFELTRTNQYFRIETPLL